MAGKLFRALQNVGFLKDAWNNVYGTVLGKKFRDLSKKDYVVNPDINDTQTYVPEKTGADIAVTKTEGEPKQDLTGEDTKDKVENLYEPIKVEENTAPIIEARQGAGAGDTPVQVKSTGNYITTGNQGKNYGLEGIYNKEVALKNKLLQNDVLEFIAYASKFGNAGAGFVNQAMNMLYPMKYQQKKVAPAFNKDEYMRGDEGQLLRMVYDIDSDKWIPIDTGMKYDQMHYKEPKVEWIPFENNGKLSYINPYDRSQTQDTDVDWWSYDKNPVIKAQIDASMNEILVKAQLSNSGNGNRGNRGDGEDDGNTGGYYPDFIEQGMGKEPWKNEPIIMMSGEIQNQRPIGYDQIQKDLVSENKKKRRDAYNFFKSKGFQIISKEEYEHPEWYENGKKLKTPKNNTTNVPGVGKVTEEQIQKFLKDNKLIE